MALLLREADVKRLLSMRVAIDAVESAFRASARGSAGNLPRRRVSVPDGALNVMAAGLPEVGLLGVKCYTAFATAGARHVFLLYDAGDGSLLALLEADWLGRIRTGAATGVATRYLARPEAQILAIIGTGGQAWTQVEAICQVRPITHLRVSGRDQHKAGRFATEAASRLGVIATACATAREAVEQADVVTTMTTSADPVVNAEWLADGVHVNAVGSNWPHKRELDDGVLARASLIVVDALDAARLEAGELIHGVDHGVISWDAVHDLGEVVAGSVGRRTDREVTLFKSVGLALEDVAVAATVYHAARAAGTGEWLPFAEVES